MNVGSPVELSGLTVGPPVSLQSVTVGPPVVFPGGSSQLLQYVHTQTVPATVWTVTHNLGRRPAAITVFSLDYATQWDEFSIHHVSSSVLYIATDVAIPGVALIE